jgi:hypothetical protein
LCCGVVSCVVCTVYVVSCVVCTVWVVLRCDGLYGFPSMSSTASLALLL